MKKVPFRADLWWVFAALALMFAGLGPLIAADGLARFEMINEIFEGQKPGSIYSAIGPLFAAPLLLLGSIFGMANEFCAHYNLVLTTLAVVLTFRWMPNQSLAARFSLLLIAATMFPFHLKHFYGEPFTVLCVWLGLLLLCVQRRWILGSIVFGLGVANTPATLVGAGLACGFLFLIRKNPRDFAPVVFALLMIFAENWIRRGNPLQNAYGGLSSFSTPLVIGVLSVLFSFGKGVFFFAPGLMAYPVSKKVKESLFTKELDHVLIASLGFLLGLVLIYVKWASWFGGDYWGPRFFLFAGIPTSLLLLKIQLGYEKLSLREQLVSFFTLAFSLWVGYRAITGSVWVPMFCAENNYAQYDMCLYSPAYSVLFVPLDYDGKWISLVPSTLFYLGVSFYLMWPMARTLLSSANLRAIDLKSVFSRR